MSWWADELWFDDFFWADSLGKWCNMMYFLIIFGHMTHLQNDYKNSKKGGSSWIFVWFLLGFWTFKRICSESSSSHGSRVTVRTSLVPRRTRWSNTPTTMKKGGGIIDSNTVVHAKNKYIRFKNYGEIHHRNLSIYTNFEYLSTSPQNHLKKTLKKTTHQVERPKVCWIVSETKNLLTAGLLWGCCTAFPTRDIHRHGVGVGSQDRQGIWLTVLALHDFLGRFKDFRKILTRKFHDVMSHHWHFLFVCLFSFDGAGLLNPP